MRELLDTKDVTAIVDVVASSIAFSVADLPAAKSRVALFIGRAKGDLTTTRCGPNHVHWVYDTWARANGTGKSLVQKCQDSWFFITADTTFGQSLQANTAAIIKQAGGTVVGEALAPFPGTTDLSSYIVQAQSSWTKVIGLANAGTDTAKCIMQAAKFGVKQQLAGLLFQIADVHAIGLEQVKNDQNDGKMKATATNSPLFNRGLVRADGRVIRDMYLFQVIKSAESKGSWDYYKLRQVIPAAQAFRPMDPQACKRIRA